jgi:N-methylhydantoinase B
MTHDPFSLELIQDSLYAITEEMGAELTRIAYSTIIRESHDCATGITDSSGQTVAQAALTPGHFMTISSATKGVLSVIPAESFRPGDVVITNDPWICAGHLPDLFVITPFFYEGQLLAFLSSVAHHIDVGGKNPGSTTPNTSSIYDEGIQIPPVKLYDAGVLAEGIIDIWKQNSRMPEIVATDIQAQVAVTRTGTRRLTELTKKFGPELVLSTMTTVLNRSETLAREVFSQIPDGVFEASDFVDDDGWTDEPIPIHVQLEVRGSDLYVDFAGSGNQTRGGVNVTPSYRDAYTQMVIRCFTDPSIPQNEGCYRPVHISAPAGSVLNPTYPAAVAGRHTCIPRLADVVAAVMSDAVPGKALAGYGGMLGQPVFSRTDPRLGRPWMFMDNSHGGTGARFDRDGVDCVSWPWNAANHSIEVLEAQAPVRIEQFTLQQDSEGPGRFRGGLGLIKDYHFLEGPVNVQVGGDRTKAPATGLAGGGTSVPQQYLILRGDEHISVRSKSDVTLEAGDTFSVRMPGGGGYESPLERDAELVLRDTQLAYISIDRARSAYGVVITPDGNIDWTATTTLRKTMGADARVL